MRVDTSRLLRAKTSHHGGSAGSAMHAAQAAFVLGARSMYRTRRHRS